MITLTNVSSARGAPMGRPDEGNIVFAVSAAVEWMPFVDGNYDTGGAYWGGGHPMYCVVGYDEAGEEVSREYYCTPNRDFLLNDLCEIYCFEGTFLPETGSIVKQTIEQLQAYQATLREDEEELVESTQDEIAELEGWLEEKGLK